MSARKAEHVLTPIPRPGMVRPETVMSNDSYTSGFSYDHQTAYSETSTKYVRQTASPQDPDPPYTRPAAAAPPSRPHDSLSHQRAASQNFQQPTMTYHPPDSPPPMSKDFAQKLRSLLRDDSLEKYIYWNSDGKSFRIRDHPNLTDKLHTLFASGGSYLPIRVQLQQNGFQVMVVETRSSGTTGTLYDVLDCRRPDFTQDIRSTQQDIPITASMGRLNVSRIENSKSNELPPSYSKPEPQSTRPAPRPKELSTKPVQSEPKLEVVARALIQRNKDMADLLEERENDYRILFNSVQDYMTTQSLQSQQAFLEILRRNKEFHGYVHPLQRSLASDDGSDDYYDDMMS